MNIVVIEKCLKKLKIYDLVRGIWRFICRLKREKNYFKLRKNGLEALIQIKEALDETSVPFWLEYGTLLGIIRNKNFIKGDDDIDIGIFMKDRPEYLVDILSKRGINKKYEFVIDDEMVEESFNYKGIGIDIFYYWYTDTNIYTYCFYKVTDETKLMDDIYDTKKNTFKRFTEFTEVEFKGSLFHVPGDAEFSLEERYGAGWKIPDRNWHHSKYPNSKLIEVKGKKKYFDLAANKN